MKHSHRHILRSALAAFLLLSVLVPGAARADRTIPVNSSAARFSPGNWAGDTGRGGGRYRRSWNNGAYCSWYWSTPVARPTATLQIANPTPGSAVSCFLDGSLVDNVPVPASGGIVLQGLSGPGKHVLMVVLRNSRQENRWDGSNACTITGLTVDDRAKPLALPAWNGRWALIVGDSITEGIMADNGRDDALADYSFLIGQTLRRRGYEYGISACGYSGWIRPGDATGDVPPYYSVVNGVHADVLSRWNKIDAHTSLLDSRGHLSAYGATGQEPSVIFLNYGVNEAVHNGSTHLGDLRASVVGSLSALRRAAPHTRIIVCVPPGLAGTAIYTNGPGYVRTLKADVLAYQKTHPGDKRLTLLDLGPGVANALASPAYGANVHPNTAGHAYLASQLLSSLLAGL